MDFTTVLKFEQILINIWKVKIDQFASFLINTFISKEEQFENESINQSIGNG